MAQLILNDRVKETTTTTGTGTINLAGAEEGFETFVAGVGNGKETFYSIFAGTEFEVGRGTVTDASPDTLSRTTVISSSNSDNKVDFLRERRQLSVPILHLKHPLQVWMLQHM